MSRKNILIISFVLVVGLCCLPINELLAQCPMCKMSAESNMSNGGTAGNGLNKGILFLLSLPYVLIGTLGFVWWKNKKKISDLSD